MTKLISMILFGCLSFTAFAEDITPEEYSSQPEIHLVKDTHDFCSEQFSTDQEATMENFILACVNEDLEASMYKTFNSYPELIAFITKTEES